MILSKIHRSYILIGILLYAILFIYWRDSISFFNTINVFVFASYAFILSFCLNKNENFYTNRNLIAITFLYSFIFVSVYIQLSDYYMGNSFMFSEVDSRYYERFSYVMKDMSFNDALAYISRYWGYDDWGAPMSMAFMLKIFPSKLFVNFCYLLMNVIGSFCLFNIGKMVMSPRYSFIGTLVYAISSYSLFYISCFLKEEMMVTLVILCLYFLYKYIQRKQVIYLAIGLLLSLSIFFFRTPVAIFVWISYGSLLLTNIENKTVRVFFWGIVLVICFIAFSFVVYSLERYANGGQLTTSYEFLHTNIFQKAVLYIGALIGPFPQLLQVGDILHEKSLYGSGVLYKLLLFLPFWKGVSLCVREKEYLMYPLFAFIFLEMAGLSVALDGLELRKALPHVPFFIIAAFWFMFKYDDNVDYEVLNSPYYIKTNTILNGCIIFVFVAALIWNTIRFT